MLGIPRKIVPLVLSALFAATTATSIVATQAEHPQIASAQGYPMHHRGYYRWHGRYWAHRTWHRGYWAAGHRWQPGVYVYF